LPSSGFAKSEGSCISVILIFSASPSKSLKDIKYCGFVQNKSLKNNNFNSK
jgi:hypothetical protein